MTKGDVIKCQSAKEMFQKTVELLQDGIEVEVLDIKEHLLIVTEVKSDGRK